MTKGEWAVIIGAIGLIPVWRSGLRTDMNFYEFVLEHTIFSPRDVLYVPEEYLTRGETNGIYMEIR